MSAREYLETFFEEKQLPYESWDLVDDEGTTHFIDSEVVKAAIFEAPGSEQQQIANTIRQIDFHNGDVNHFLHHLAQALVYNY